MNLQLKQSTEEFLQRCEVLTREAAEKAAEKKFAMKRLEEAATKVEALVNKFNEVDVPVVNGEPVLNLKIDTARLNQAQYVLELNKKFPDILNNLEVKGSILLNEAIKKSRTEDSTNVTE